jgi:hypothetical protein
LQERNRRAVLSNGLTIKSSLIFFTFNLQDSQTLLNFAIRFAYGFRDQNDQKKQTKKKVKINFGD